MRFRSACLILSILAACAPPINNDTGNPVIEDPGSNPPGNNTPPINHSPSAMDASFTVAEGAAVSFSDADLRMFVSDADAGAVLSLVVHPHPSNLGQLVAHGDGTYTFTVNPMIPGLALGETVVDSFEFSARDETQLSSPLASIRITITGVNSAPTGMSDMGGGFAGMPLVVDWRSNDTDPDGDVLSIASTDAPVGVVEDRGDGTLLYRGDFSALDVGESLNLSFHYVATDGHGANTASTAVSITVQGLNDGPICPSGGTASVLANGMTALDVKTWSQICVDPEGDTFTYLFAEGPTGAVVQDIGNGNSSVTPNPAAWSFLAAGVPGIYDVVYTVEDARGARGTGIYHLKIIGIDDPPTAVNDTFDLEESGVQILLPLANDIEPDGEQKHLVSIGAPGLSGAFAISGNTVSFDPGTLFDHLAEGQTLQGALSYVMSDGTTTSSATMMLTMHGRNNVPVAQDDAITIVANADAYIPVLLNDTDADHNAALSLVSVSAPSGGTNPVVNLQGSYVGFFTQDTGALAYPYVVTFSYAMRDELAATPPQIANVTVTVQAPAAVSIGAFSIAKTTMISDKINYATWTSQNATYCYLRDDQGQNLAGGAQANAQWFVLDRSMVLTLLCSNNTGEATQTIAVSYQPAVFVDDDITGTQDGRTWETAFSNLGAAATGVSGQNVEVWIKEGVYRASAPGEPVLILPPAAQVIGGFAQAATGQQGTTGGVSYLDGDQDESGSHSADDSKHVVVLASGGHLSKVTVRNGYAANCEGGGGFYGTGISATFVQDVVVENNTAHCASGAALGGGVYLSNSQNIHFESSLFTANTAVSELGDAFGGGAYATMSMTPLFNGSTFNSNTAIAGTGTTGTTGGLAAGGAIAAVEATNLYMVGAQFLSNVARAGAGGAAGPAALGSDGPPGGAGGSARGGAIYVISLDPESDTTRPISVVFSGNQAIGGNGAAGGNAAPSMQPTTGGSGGAGGHSMGGAFFISNGYGDWADSTCTGNSALGGNGADGGLGFMGPAGATGNGGLGAGGCLYSNFSYHGFNGASAFTGNTAAGGASSATPGSSVGGAIFVDAIDFLLNLGNVLMTGNLPSDGVATN